LQSITALSEEHLFDCTLEHGTTAWVYTVKQTKQLLVKHEETSCKVLGEVCIGPDMQTAIDGFRQTSHIDAIQEGECVEMINDEMPLNQQLF